MEAAAASETINADDKVAQELADQAKTHTNGNGTGESNNGSTGESKARGTFDMWDDLANETEQDKKRKENPNANTQEEELFGSHDARNDVTDDDLRSDTMTLKEANAEVSLYMAFLDMGISFLCCGIRDDFSVRTQLKYRIHPWRKKAIQIPWVRLIMLPGRKRRPALALCMAMAAGTVPTIALAYMDNWHDKKRKEDPEYQKRTNDGGNGSGAWKVYRDPRAQESPGYSKADAEYAEYEEVGDDANRNDDDDTAGNGKSGKGKPGRHAKTCPKHLDTANGICNCK